MPTRSATTAPSRIGPWCVGGRESSRQVWPNPVADRVRVASIGLFTSLIRPPLRGDMAIGTTFEPRLRHDKDDVALPETKASYRPGGNARLLSSLPDRADAGRAIPGGRTRTRGSLSGSTPLSMCEISRSSSRLSYRGPVSPPPRGNVLEGTALWGRPEEGNAKHSGDSLGSGGRPVFFAPLTLAPAQG